MFENTYKSLLSTINEGKSSVILTYMNFINDKSGDISKKLVLSEDDILANSQNIGNELLEKINYSLETGKPYFLALSENKSVFIEPFFPKPRLVIFGGGHIAKPLVELGVKVGFSAVVIDDRPSFANKSRFPEADEVICESFENSFNTIKLRNSDFVVIVTRGHKHDGTVLRNALGYSLKYLGMIGSRRRVKAMMEQLSDEGFSKEKLDKVNSPIGLDIGAVTPEEIAVSIIGQVISFRRKSTDASQNKSFNWPEFDKDVIEKACEESEIPKALITIIASKGSVPRKAGAKMIEYLDGRTLGSIGGGCSEADVLTKARDIMLNKGFSIEHVDLTGDVAEDEGMVCGGIMDVLIESF